MSPGCLSVSYGERDNVFFLSTTGYETACYENETLWEGCCRRAVRGNIWPRKKVNKTKNIVLNSKYVRKINNKHPIFAPVSLYGGCSP